MKKLARTISGVTPVAVMAAPAKCPGTCVYCPDYEATPRSYTPESPAVFRARSCGYDTRAQITLRLKALAEMGHPVDKVELIVMGGTFLAQSVEYQYRFIKECFDALNEVESSSLDEAKRTNETARRRCVGLCIETRPDWCGPEEIERMLEFGATRVELGVQTLDDDIFRLVRRGHLVEDVAVATTLLRQHGFKVYYHWMPGLPGSSPEKDVELALMLFDDARFRPDGLKLYPTVVVEGTELEKWYREGLYRPYDVETMIDVLVRIKSIVPKYVRIPRVLRDIPPRFIVEGCKDSLRSILKERMEEHSIECHCIRCREYGHRRRDCREIGAPGLVRMDYEAAGGREVLLSFEDAGQTLFGLLRLRIQPQPVPGMGESDGGNIALVRELHIYGPEVPLNGQAEGAAQHRGFGRALLREAERVARDEHEAKRLFVLSGVGSREYYRTECGYTRHGDYMVKTLGS